MSFKARPELFALFRGRGVVCLLVTLLASSALILLTQQAAAQGSKASITGYVADSAGGVLQGASVTVQPGGNSSVSDNAGQYSVTNLPAGKYTITISYSGFAAFTKE